MLYEMRIHKGVWTLTVHFFFFFFLFIHYSYAT